MITCNFIRMTILESMKQLTFLLLFIGFSISSSAQEVDMERISFVNKFYKAVVSHKQSKVIKLMDRDHRKEQIKLLGGNKEQFVNELFSGIDIHTEKYFNVKLSEIENIEIQKINDLGDGKWEYIFHIKSGELLLEQSLTLRKSGKKYGFIGAVG